MASFSTLTLDSLTSSGCVEVVTIEDSIYEENESFEVVLKSSDLQAVVGGPVPVTIIDNDNGYFLSKLYYLCVPI